jgi:hypothetical protein
MRYSAALCVLTLSTFHLSPQQPSPDLVSIIAKHVEKRGGQARFDALTSVRRTCRVDSFVVAGTWAGDRVRLDQFETEGGSQETRAAIGTAGWVQPGGQSSAPIRSEDVVELRNTVAMGFELFVHRALDVTIALGKPQMVEGRQAHVLTLTRPGGGRTDLLLDAETALEIARVRHVAAPDGHSNQMHAAVSGHQSVGGILFPHGIGLCGAEWEVNVPAPASLFERPR